jgi:hypothetical protein
MSHSEEYWIFRDGEYGNLRDDGREQGKELPIFFDSETRGLTDVAKVEVDPGDWYPANKPSSKIWRCLEALRDVSNLVQGGKELDEGGKRRRAKIVVVPLYSFIEHLRSTCNYILDKPNMKERLDKAAKANLRKHLKAFSRTVPVERPSILRTVRNKLSAHVDRKMSPREAAGLMKDAPPHEVGRWLHNGILLLCEVLSVDVFAWGTDDCPEGCLRLMTAEPFLVTLRKGADGELAKIVSLHVSQSPKYLFTDRCQVVVEQTQWMFRDGDPRIRSLGSPESEA